MRLERLPPAVAARWGGLPCPQFRSRPWVEGKPLSQRRVAIASTAGLFIRGQKPFRFGDDSYRTIPTSTPIAQLLLSHASVNFDRTGFQEDANVLFPLDRLNELAAERTIGSVAQTHFGMMGATPALRLELAAREVAARLKADRVDAVVLCPA